MPRARLMLFLFVTFALVGSLVATAGYAWYLRSDARRLCFVTQLTDYLKLPSEIDSLAPRGRNSQAFFGVVVHLPDRRGKALSCRQALLISTPTPEDPEAYEVELRGGLCEISTDTWLRGDYRHLLESGLRPSFDPGGPREVRFDEMDVTFIRDAFHLTLHDADGRVSFADRTRGVADISCKTLNGHVAGDFVTLSSAFSPRPHGIRLDHTELRVPRLPIAVLGLGDLLGTPIRSGGFEGRLTYSEADDGRRVRVSGSCFDIDLSEWTAPFVPQPWHGVCPELQLVECVLRDRSLERLRFRGVLNDLRLGDILTTWGFAGVGGQTTLRVGDAELTPDGISRLVASGQCVDLALDTLTDRLGWGLMTGTARCVIDDLTIEHNRLRSLSARIIVDDSANANIIEGRLVREIVNRAMRFDLPPMLPQRIEYTHFGVRLDVKDEQLYVLGTHGERDRTILTVRLFGQEIPLVPQPPSAIDLRPWCDALRDQLQSGLRRRLEALSQRSPPASQP